MCTKREDDYGSKCQKCTSPTEMNQWMESMHRLQENKQVDFEGQFFHDFHGLDA